MKLHSLTKLALALTLTLAGVGCSVASADNTAGASANVTSAREVRASTDPSHAPLGGLWAIKPVSGSDRTLRIYETGGGDPAMNGNILWLGADNGEGGMFDLGLNVLTLEKAEQIAAGKLVLSGLRHGMTSDGEIVEEAWQATITFTTPDDAFGPTITVKHDAVEETVAASTEDPSKFLGSIYDAKAMESADGTIARVFTAAGGDPAMNGASIYLSIMAYPEERIYDLGLDVGGVTKLEHKSATELRIEGSEDTMGASGDIQQRPFAYSVKFSIGLDGVPSQSVKLTKLPR